MKEDLERSQLGEKLKNAREYGGFSQEEVAKYLGLPRTAISLLESGARRLDLLEAKKLSTLYKCSLEELMSETPPQKLDSVQMVARAAGNLSPEDRDEVLRFAQFLQSKKSGKPK